MAEQAGEFLGIGVVAKRLGVSRSAVRLWERQGRIPAAARLAGSDRRVYRTTDLDLIVKQLEARRREAGDATPLTAA